MGGTDILLMRFSSFTIEIKSKFFHFLSADFLLWFFFRLYINFLGNLEMKSNNKCSNYDTNEEILNGKFAVKAPPLLLINTARSSFDRSGKVLKLQLVYHYYSISVNILQVIMFVRPKYPLKF